VEPGGEEGANVALNIDEEPTPREGRIGKIVPVMSEGWEVESDPVKEGERFPGAYNAVTLQSRDGQPMKRLEKGEGTVTKNPPLRTEAALGNQTWDPRRKRIGKPRTDWVR